MNVNKANHFAKISVSSKRKLNRFYQPHGLHTTFDSGKLIPIYLKEVLPNDVRKLKWSSVCRLLTPKFPTMDNARLDTFFFYVRNRDLWNHWQEFMGQNDSPTQPWVNPVKYKVPTIQIPMKIRERNDDYTQRKVGDLADYLGIPCFSGGTTSNQVYVNHLPFRAVCKVWNEYFRDENYQLPCYWSDGDSTSYYNLGSGSDYVQRVFTGQECPPVNRYKDYFSSCLPSPQKGQAVELSLGDYAPIISGDGVDAGAELKFKLPTFSAGKYLPYINNSAGISGEITADWHKDDTLTNDSPSTRPKILLRADLSAAASVTVNAMRMAFQTQRFLEQSARGGTRYVELLASMFGVSCPDIYLNRAEFLGGKSFPINVTPVTNVGSESSLGSVGGMSSTVSGDFAFKKHFSEHGYIIGFACVRTDRSYSQGIERHWFRTDKLDYYFPAFAHIGEQPVLKREICALGVKNSDESVWGYNEAWSEYRFALNQCSGYMRAAIGADSLIAWTYTDYYDLTAPTFNSSWLTYQKEIIDRTITLQNKMQFIADFYFDDVLYSVVSSNSNPGLIDH